MWQLTWKGAGVVFGGIFSFVVFGGVLSAPGTIYACTSVCISETCSDGTTNGSCCRTSEPGNDACSCTPDPLPGCPAPSPCHPSMGVDCSSSAGVNACGMYGNGTIQCDGSCDAVAPPDSLCPSCVSNQGSSCTSAQNSCGMTYSGTIQCDGSCDVAPPSDTLCSTEFMINASAGPGGSISPSGTIAVFSGGSQLFNFIPISGFRVDTVFVDGVDMGVTAESFQLNNVLSNHTVMVVFESTSTTSCGNGIVEPGETCDNGASSNGVCPASCSASCTDNTCASAQALNICPDGATILTRGTQPLKAWYTSAGTNFISCSDTTGAIDRTLSVQWTSSNPERASVNSSGVVTAGAISNTSVLITANYPLRSVSDTATINILAPPCDETRTCDAAAANRCSGDAFTIAGVCGRINCVGTRSCDYNWKEVSP